MDSPTGRHCPAVLLPRPRGHPRDLRRCVAAVFQRAYTRLVVQAGAGTNRVTLSTALTSPAPPTPTQSERSHSGGLAFLLEVIGRDDSLADWPPESKRPRLERRPGAGWENAVPQARRPAARAARSQSPPITPTRPAPATRTSPPSPPPPGAAAGAAGPRGAPPRAARSLLGRLGSHPPHCPISPLCSSCPPRSGATRHRRSPSSSPPSPPPSSLRSCSGSATRRRAARRAWRPSAPSPPSRPSSPSSWSWRSGSGRRSRARSGARAPPRRPAGFCRGPTACPGCSSR